MICIKYIAFLIVWYQKRRVVLIGVHCNQESTREKRHSAQAAWEENEGVLLAVPRAKKQVSIPDFTAQVHRGLLVRLAGIEPTTLGFGGQYSIH